MKMAPVQAAAFFFLHSALLSKALVAPTRRIGFIREYESTSSFMKEYGWAVSSVERNCHLMERKRNDAYDVAPTETSLQERVEVFLAPAAELLEDKSDGWALSYADLTPDSERTLSGQAFLATNLAYTIVGIFLSLQGEVLLGVLTELCSIASFSYHYTQLQQPYGRTQDSTVRLALMVDYIFAVTTILVGLFYVFIGHAVPPIEGLATGILGIVCLLSCWVYEYGTPYIILHGMWHLFSAATGYFIGASHAMS